MTRVAEACLDWLWRNGAERLCRAPWGDHLFSVLDFRFFHGYFPNLRRPSTLSEHLLRLKLSPAIVDPLRQFVTDKEWLKLYVRASVGERYVVPTFAILRSADEVMQFAFPARCMIKPTHSSARRVLRRDADQPIDRAELIRWLSHNFYPGTREANYRYLTPKVIVEEVVLFEGKLPADYKIHCFAGRPKLIHVLANRMTSPVCGPLYTTDWEALPFTLAGPRGFDAPRPPNLDEILDVARRLAAPFSYIRVDLYTDGKRICIGELTNIPANAKLRFQPPHADRLTARFFEDPDLDTLQAYAELVRQVRPGTAGAPHDRAFRDAA